MNTADLIVEWQADQGSWLIYSGSVDTARNLEDWAQEQPELSTVILKLSARNYATHWVSLPGVKGRNLSRALPFALEETLIGDIADYTVIPGDSVKGNHKAYVAETDLIDRLLELLALHHVRLTALVPETAGYESHQMIRHSDGWLLIKDSMFEGLIPDAALSSVFDHLTAKGSCGEISV
ncbi:MAG: type II secretion system protein GspL, partial [Thalassolituus sp.]